MEIIYAGYTLTTKERRKSNFLSYLRKFATFTFKIKNFLQFGYLIQYLKFWSLHFNVVRVFFQMIFIAQNTDTRATCSTHTVWLKWRDENGRISENRYSLCSKGEQAFNMWATQNPMPLEIPQTQNVSI